MISEFKQIEDLFKEIDGKLTKKVNIYIIGGAALLFEGLKPATKDIDLILENESEFSIFNKALISLNFKQEVPTNAYKKMELDTIMIREDYRIDAFLKKVCKKFALSKNMIKRSDELLNLKNIIVYKCSNEDIFLFKSMTERPGDLEDCVELVKKGLDWNVIKNELIYQINNTGQDVWITWVGESFDKLLEKGLTIPIMNDINKLRDDFFTKFEKNDKV